MSGPCQVSLSCPLETGDPKPSLKGVVGGGQEVTWVGSPLLLLQATLSSPSSAG